MTRNQVKALMALRGVTCAGVAKELGVSASLVSQVARKAKRSPRVEAALAARLGRTADQLFGPRAVHNRTRKCS